ncbi:MAG: hydrolase [Clostridiales bacterium]|nr:hydrolase [Clostridiales bacterium]
MHIDPIKPKRIAKDDAVLVVVDFQEKIVPAMREGASAAAEAAKLIRGFEALGCPVLATQQYTKGLGGSVPEIREAFSSFSHIEKSSFSAMGESAFVSALDSLGRKTVVLCGIEAHVCVLQTALDMLAAGYDVFLATDAVSSRKERDEKPGVKRMIRSGVMPTTVESALFELLDNDSKSDTFKTISRLIR